MHTEEVKHADTTKGQVRLAVASEANFKRWGQHFLPQALSQYTYECATNFKDAYSTDCRTGTMKAIYDDLVRTGLGLPPPVASRAPSRRPVAADTNADLRCVFYTPKRWVLNPFSTS